MDGIAALRPTGINSRGDVVGTTLGDASSASKAFFYDGSSRTTVCLRAPGTSSQTATAINTARRIAGWVAVADDGPTGSRQRPVLWEDATIVYLDVPVPATAAAGSANALALNELGTVVGWFVPADWQHAVVWAGGAMRDVGLGASPGSVAMAINGTGIAAGFSARQRGNTSELHAVVFGADRVSEIVDVPGAENSTAEAINDSGGVVGVTFPSAHPEEIRAFVYDLPTGRLRTVAPDRRCDLHSINASGVAVGDCTTGAGYDFTARAVILRGDTLEDLDDVVRDPAWSFTTAQAINDRGEIAGTGVHDGKPRGYVLIPHP